MLENILYLSAGSRRWGAGHLSRSKQLIRILRQRGAVLKTFAYVPEQADAESLNPFLNVYDATACSLNEISLTNPSGIIVDVNTEFQPELFAWLEARKIPTVALDWYNERGTVIKAVANLRGGASALKYCLIREEFRKALQKPVSQIPDSDAVVVMGGGDPRDCLSKVFKLFHENRNFADYHITIIVGPMVTGRLAKLAGQSIGPLKLIKNPDNLADVMAGATIGLTNGGTTLMEFSSLGIPTIIFPQSEEEDNFIQPFLEHGGSLSGSLEQTEFVAQIHKLWENKKMRNSMREKAMKLIDGLGGDRIADLIFKTFSESNK
ncbi:MAG: glycosyltransferase [bacterium]